MWRKKKVSAGCQEGRESQNANYKKLLREVGPTDRCFGSVASFMIRPVNQLSNRTLLCKLKYLIPTVLRQRAYFLFFFVLLVFFSQIQQLVAEVNYFHGSYSAVTSPGGGEKRKEYVSDSYVLQVHARLNCFQNAGAWDLKTLKK